MELKSLKKLLTVALVAIAALAPATMSAYDFVEGGIYYEKNGNEVSVARAGVNVASYSGDVVIPETVVHDGVEYAVTAIGYSAFSYCYDLTSIEIPNTIVSIGDHAFLHCESLQHVVVPNSVVNMGRCAFHWCTNLKTAVIGNSVPVVDEYCFQYCYQLTDVVIGASVEQINIKAFFDCYRLANVTCLAPEPPAMYAWYCFYDTNYGTATLHVPGISIEAYKNHEIWGMFTKIVSMTQATSLTFEQSLVTMNGGEQVQLKVTVEPEDASPSLQWTTSNAGVATVDANGLVTAVGPGEAIITATTLDGTELSASCTVRVYSTNVQGDNVLTVPDGLTVEKGNALLLPVGMMNKAPISGLQFDIELPEGFDLAAEGNNYLIDLLPERVTANHSLYVRELSPGIIRVLISSMNSAAFQGQEGDLLVLHLNVGSEVADGEYGVALTNVVMADAGAVTYYAPAVITTIEVKSFAKGDANGDGTVNVGDYVSVANYIMELEPDPFIFNAADVDENGSIDVGDLVGVANIVLGDEMVAAKPASESGVTLSGDCVNSADRCVVTLDLNNEMALTAWQMDVTLPQGLTLEHAKLTTRAASHQLTVNDLKNGNIRLLSSSLTNDELVGNEGALLTLELNGNATSEAKLAFGHILFAERDMTIHAARPFAVAASSSGVKELASDLRISGKDGVVIVETPVETTVELIAPNGMTRTVVAKAGINTYRVERGITIVRANGQVAKLKL